MLSEFGLLFGLLVAAGDNPPLLQPIDKWRVDFAEERCLALHSYQSERGQSATLALKPSPNGAAVQVTLAESGEVIRADQKDVTVRILGPSTSMPVRTTLLQYADKRKRIRYASFSLPADQMKVLSAASGISITGIGFQRGLALHQMSAALDLLNGCSEDLRRVWHIGGEGEAAIGQPAKAMGSMKAVFRDEDYPDIASAKSQVGKLNMLVLVDEQGRVRDCSVEQTSGVAVLDATGCISMELRGRYAPALDRAGKPVKTYAMVNLEFRMGGPAGSDWIAQ